MKKIFFSFILFFVSLNAYAQDAFKSVRCGEDISKTLIGKKTSNESVVKMEARYEAIQLKHNYGCGRLDDECIISWNICGKEFLLSESKKSIILDVLEFPAHSKSSPEFSSFPGTCKMLGKQIPEMIVGVSNNPKGVKPFSAKLAWKVNRTNFKFEKIPVENLSCSEYDVGSK